MIRYPANLTLGEAVKLQEESRDEGLCWVCEGDLCACCGQCHTGDCPECDDECVRRI